MYDKPLDFNNFLWFDDTLELLCNQDKSIIDSVIINGSIGYETNIERDRKYSTNKYKELLQQERLEYMDKLHQLDLLKEQKIMADWTLSVNDTLCEFKKFFNVSVEEALKMLNRNIYAKVSVNNDFMFTRLNNYRNRFSVSDKMSIDGKLVNIKVAINVSDERWEVKFYKNIYPSINSEKDIAVSIKGNKSYIVQAGFLISPKMKKLLYSNNRS